MAAAKKSSQRRPRPRPRVALMDASATKRARLFSAFRRVVKEHGFSDVLVGAQFDPAVSPDSDEGFGMAMAAPAAMCPPGQVRRIVCVRAPNGTVVCQPRCQPV